MKLTERETKAQLLTKFRAYGMEDQARKIIQKYEDAIKGAKNEYERHHIAACGIAELHKLLGCKGPCIVDGVEILPGQPGWEKDADDCMRLVKLD